jgi:hypothetical protein
MTTRVPVTHPSTDHTECCLTSKKINSRMEPIGYPLRGGAGIFITNTLLLLQD